MKKDFIKIFAAVLLVGASAVGCKDDLDVIDPNRPTLSVANSERGITSLAKGAVYVNGFYDLKYYDGVPGRFWTGAVGFHEIMGDIVGEEAANLYGNQIGCPDNVILDNGTTVANPQSPSKQKDLIRAVNTNANQGNNPIYFEWAYMYAMNAALNNVLSVVEKIEFSGDAATKIATVQAWCYWWKGYAFSRI